MIITSKLGEKDIFVTAGDFSSHVGGSGEDYKDYLNGVYGFGVRNKEEKFCGVWCTDKHNRKLRILTSHTSLVHKKQLY